MSLNALALGAAFAAVSIAIALLLGKRGNRLLALLLAAGAGVYVGGALAFPMGSPVFEAIGVVIWVGIAVVAIDHTILLSVGWAAHALWDVLHLQKLARTALPVWYQWACIAADVLIAAYLLYRASRERA